MGKGSETTTESEQKVTLPEPTEEEIRMNQILNEALLPGLMDASGYALEEETVTIPGMSEFEVSRRKELTALKDKKAKEDSMVNHMWGGYLPPGADTSKKTEFSSEMQAELDDLEKRYRETGGAASRTETKFTMRKKADKQTEAIREKFGKDSPEYKQAFEAYESKQIESENLQNRITEQFKENSMKFLEGDFSISDKEKESIAEVLAPQREIVKNMFDKLEDQTATGFDKMFDEHKELFEKNRELLSDQVQEYGQEITNQMAASAAAMGRDPMDPEFQMEIQKSIAKQAVAGGKALSIKEAEQRMNLLGSRIDAETSLTRGRGAAEASLAEQAMGLRMQKFSPMGAQVAMNTNQLSSAINQQNLANLGSLTGTYSGERNKMLQERGMESTTTGTQTQRQSGNLFADILGVGTGIASAVSGFGTANALKGLMAPGGGGGGNSAWLQNLKGSNIV